MRMLAGFLLALLVVSPGESRKSAAQTTWEQFRTVLDHGNCREPVVVRLVSSERIEGKLGDVTASGLRLRDSSAPIPRKDIRSVRLFVRKNPRSGFRRVALILGIPYGASALAAGALAHPIYLPLIGVPLGLYGVAALLDQESLVLELRGNRQASVQDGSSDSSERKQ